MLALSLKVGGVGSTDQRGKSERKSVFSEEGCKVKGGSRTSTSGEFRFNLSRETDKTKRES